MCNEKTELSNHYLAKTVAILWDVLQEQGEVIENIVNRLKDKHSIDLSDIIDQNSKYWHKKFE